eukprot:s3009_g10.t1
MEGCCKFIEKLNGELYGFIHSAGVLQDSMLMNLTWEKFETVYQSKHHAALFLHYALEQNPQKDFRFMWNFSSTSVYGNMGQLNYSGSNSFLDVLTRHRKAKGRPSLAIQWGAWGDVGMAATMTDAMRLRRGIFQFQGWTMNSPMPYFSNKEGLHGLECGLQTGLAYFSVFKFNPPVMMGSVQFADAVPACFHRNHYSEVCPTPPAPTLERKHYYTIYRMSKGPQMVDAKATPLVYNAYATLLSILEGKESESKAPKKLRIYDPFYCAGSVVKHLMELGFPQVYNKCEDFYAVVREGRVPEHDVLLTNPPYSGDHVEQLLRFCRSNGKPFLLLMPNYFCAKDFYEEALGGVAMAKKVLYLCPRKRYFYWTPKGLRKRGKVQTQHAGAGGNRTSPFISFWFLDLAPLIAAKALLRWWQESGPWMSMAYGLAGADSCCRAAADVPAEVIQSEGRGLERPNAPPIPGDRDDPEISVRNVSMDNMDTSYSDRLAPIEEEHSGPGSPGSPGSGDSPLSPGSPSCQSIGWKKMMTMRHMEIDFEILRGIPLHRALRQPELWTSPHEIRRTNRAAQVWDLSTRVSSLDIFLSHSWKSKGRWKVLALMMQTGWLHGLLGWSVGLAVMLFLRAFEIVSDTWKNVDFIIAGRQITTNLSIWTLISAEVSMVLGICLAPYVPFKTQMCFLDVACIHQDQLDMFERGLYSIGGCLSAAKELRVLYSPEYLSSLWCWFELVGFRRANPEGKIVFAPLFIERSAAICALIEFCFAILINVVLGYADMRTRQANTALYFLALLFLPVVFVVHTMRCNYKEKGRLILDLTTFDVDKLVCTSDFDRAFILSAIAAWYGSKEALRDFVRSTLREELLGLLPSPHLPLAYAALILSSLLAWNCDMTLSLYKSGATWEELLRHVLLFYTFFTNWFWCALNGIFYLSDKTSSPGGNRLLDWSKTLAVAGVMFLWCFVGFTLCVILVRSTTVVGLVLYVMFSMTLPLFILDAFKGGMVDYLGDVDEETKSKVAASAGYPLSMLQRPSQKAKLDEAMAAAAEDWFSSNGKGPNVAEPVAEDRPQESAEKSAFSKQGLVLKCLDGLDWELQDTEDALSVTVTFTHELWLGLCGVSGTAFKEAVSFELAEEELRVLHAGSVVLDLRLPATVDAPNASASVSSRKMRVAVKAPKISKAT